MANENTRTIETYIDSLGENWQKNGFVDRLDSVKSIIANEGYPQGAEEAIEAFLALDPATRDAVIRRLRVRNQVLEWAAEAEDDEAVLALAADLEALTNPQGA
jgi:hypothetical protein